MKDDISVKKWVGTLVLMAIPIVNIVFLCIWAFGKENPRRNYSRAQLIVFSTLIGSALFLGLLGSIFSLSTEQKETGSMYPDNYFDLQEQENKELSNNLEILEMSIENKDGNKEIVGIVQNNSQSISYSSFVIEGNVYDKEGLVIQTVDIVIKDTVPPGERLKFNKWGIHFDASTVKTINLRGKTAFD